MVHPVLLERVRSLEEMEGMVMERPELLLVEVVLGELIILVLMVLMVVMELAVWLV